MITERRHNLWRMPGCLIAQTKLPDLNTDDLYQAKLQVAGTARSMGITVDGA